MSIRAIENVPDCRARAEAANIALTFLAAVIASGLGPAVAFSQDPRGLVSMERRLSPSAVDPQLQDGARQPGAVSSSHGEEPLKLGAAELLTIRIHGYANLSSDYRVNADETISIPVVGRISIKDKDARELEQELSKRVSTITGAEGYATVEVARYRSILVTGAVAKAGTYQWAPGMRVLHAEALSGGLARDLVENAMPSIDSREKLDRATAEMKQTLAQIARLRAERKGEQEIAVPKELVWIAGDTEAKDLMQTQRMILASSLAAHKAQLTTLNQAIATTEEELRGLDAGIQLIERQVASRRSRTTALAELQAKGILPKERMIESAERTIDFEERRNTAQVLALRARGTLLTMKQDLVKLSEVRNETLDKEILALERDVQKLGIEIDSARTAQRLLKRGDTAEAGKPERRVAYMIIRQDAEGIVRIPAEQLSNLRPGDILVISES